MEEAAVSRADQFREFVLSKKGQLEDIIELCATIEFAWSSVLCKTAREKLVAWRRELYDGIHEFTRDWPIPDDPTSNTYFVDFFAEEALNPIICRIIMVQGALEAIEREDTSDPTLWESVGGVAPQVLEEVWEDLVTATEKFIAEYLPADEPASVTG